MAGEKVAMPTGLELLRVPFAANHISKLPKQMSKNDQDKGKCERGSRYSADGTFCGGWHARSIHLDFVGHAALTDRLLDADPLWSWEPMALEPNGMPAFDTIGGLWIRLTVCGVTRLGYGDAQGKTGPNAVKETIGDALRNAAMRFGAALDLWHKGELHTDEAAPAAVEPPNARAPESPGSAPAAGAVSAIAIRKQLAELATERHWPLDAVASQFAEWSQGADIKTAKGSLLFEFLTQLRDGTVAVA
jgi:hypothetical protein